MRCADAQRGRDGHPAAHAHGRWLRAPLGNQPPRPLCAVRAAVAERAQGGAARRRRRRARRGRLERRPQEGQHRLGRHQPRACRSMCAPSSRAASRPAAERQPRPPARHESELARPRLPHVALGAQTRTAARRSARRTRSRSSPTSSSPRSSRAAFPPTSTWPSRRSRPASSTRRSSVTRCPTSTPTSPPAPSTTPRSSTSSTRCRATS